MMNYRQWLLTGALTVSLSACSLFGERPESTRLDLDSPDIKPVKIFTKKPSTDASPDDKTNQANVDPKTIIKYEATFLQPGLTKEDIKNKGINFAQILQVEKAGQKEKLKEGDALTVFSALGAKMTGDYVIQKATDDLKKEIGYDDNAIHEKHAAFITAYPECEEYTYDLIAVGTAQFDLNKTELGPLLKNTTKDDTAAGALKEFLEDAYTDANTKEDERTVDKLPKRIRNDLQVQFNPALNKLILKKFLFGEVCVPPSPNAQPRGFINDGDGYAMISDKNIVKDDQNKTISINIVRDNFPTSQMPMYNVEEQKTIPLGKVTFNDTVSVATTDCQKHSTYKIKMESLVIKDPQSAGSKTGGNQGKDKKPTDKPTDISGQSSKVTDPATGAATNNNNSRQPSTNNNNQSGSNDVKTSNSANQAGTEGIPPLLQRLQDPNAAGVQVADKDKKDSIKSYPVTSVTAISEIVQAFPKKDRWFDMNIKGHTVDFYEEENGKLVYRPNPKDANYSFWDRTEYGTLKNINGKDTWVSDYLTTRQVETLCEHFDFTRELTFNVKIHPPGEINESKFIQKNGLSLSYQEDLVNEFTKDKDPTFPDTPYRNAVTGALHTPQGMNEQEWKVRICFDPRNGAKAFLSSNEMHSAKVDVDPITGSVTLSGLQDNHWLEAKIDPNHFLGNVPPRFNSARKNAERFSSFFIDPKTNIGAFQLTFRRTLEADKLMAYIDQAQIKNVVVPPPPCPPGTKEDDCDLATTYKKSLIVSKMTSTFQNGQNRIEIVIYGGFRLGSPTKNDAQLHARFSPAKLLSPLQLSGSGVISLDDHTLGAFSLPDGRNLDGVAQILFMGELSNFYLNALLLPSQ